MLGLAMALGLGRLFVPTSVFVRGTVVDARTGNPVPHAELRLLPRSARALEEGNPPNARGDKEGLFTLYVSWYTEPKEVAISAADYDTLTTNLGSRALGRRNVRRDFQLQRLGSAPSALPVPPVVIRAMPQSGAADVDPALTELRVTFSKTMRDGSWSWTIWGEEHFPRMTGPPRFLGDGRTCALPVKLEPGTVYAIWLNSEYHNDFKDTGGRPALPYLLIFETRK
jgi:RNA polymerase sigma-70 factor (ECF subfamily)